MPNVFGLHFDGDLRRIYEVPENSSYTLDGSGYRIYVPDDIPSAAAETFVTHTEFWSDWVDFHDINKWSTLAFDKSGGAFAGVDQNGDDVFDEFSLRLINNWEIVPADYPHQFNLLGTIRGDLITGRAFDSARITSPGVLTQIRSAVSGTVIKQAGGGTGGSGLYDQLAYDRDDLVAAQVNSLVKNQ